MTDLTEQTRKNFDESRKILLAKRKAFFNMILENINRPPVKIDKILGQDIYYFQPNPEKTLLEEATGDIAVCVRAKFFGKEFEVYYSLWQVGENVKVGIALSDPELQGALLNDEHNEAHFIWGKEVDPRIDVAHGAVLYEWDFHEPHLYDDFKKMEKYILGFRHMHFRVLRILHDECKNNYSGQFGVKPA